MRLAIDFDNTIHDAKNPAPGKKMGPPLPGAIEALHQLQERGFELVCLTTKANTASGTRATQEWLDYYEAPPMAVLNVKTSAELYIDDRGLRHQNWPDTLTQIYERLGIEPD